MKLFKLFPLVSAFCLILSSSSAQETDFSALLLSLNGKGKVNSGSEQLDLKALQMFKKGDKIKLTDGTATVMLFSGGEIKISSGKAYTVPALEDNKENELLAMANIDDPNLNLLSQSSAAFMTRGPERHIFPAKSKLADTANFILHVKSDQKPQNGVSLKIKDAVTQKVVWQKNGITDTLIKISSENLKQGKSYYWNASGFNAMPESGIVIITTTEPAGSAPSSHIERLSAIAKHYKEGYVFKAISLADAYSEQFPETTIYSALHAKMLK